MKPRKHISEMSAQGFSAYTRTTSRVLSANRVTGRDGSAVAVIGRAEVLFAVVLEAS